MKQPKGDWKKFWFGYDSKNPKHVKNSDTCKHLLKQPSFIFFIVVVSLPIVFSSYLKDIQKQHQKQQAEIEMRFNERLHKAQNEPKVSVDHVMTEFTLNPHRAFERYSNYYSYFRYADPTLGSFTFEGEVIGIDKDCIRLYCYYIDTKTGHKKSMVIQKNTTTRSFSIGNFARVDGHIIGHIPGLATIVIN
jgi:hypothetical protein